MSLADGPVDLALVVSRYRPDLEKALREAIPSESAAPDLYDILRYHLGWLDENLAPTRARGGKLLRPTLCLLACEAVGGNYRQALPTAVALELLHNFSLIHDDVEDRGQERHGRRTVFARWGEPLAVNAGDAMLILSQLALLREVPDGLSPATLVSMIRLLNQCCLRLTEGQHLDLTLEGNPALTQEQYLAIISGKTAALLGCAAQLGALAGGASLEASEPFRQFGENLGLGFQIQDDVLGIWGDPRETGKPAAADVAGRKVTLPVILALQRAPPSVRARLAVIYQTPAPTSDQVAEAVGHLDTLGVRAEAERLAAAYVGRARVDLEAARPRPGPGAELWALARSLIGRKF